MEPSGALTAKSLSAMSLNMPFRNPWTPDIHSSTDHPELA